MKLTKLKAVFAAALVAGAGASAWAEDAPEEEVVATAEASFWLGGDEIVVASGEAALWLGPDEIAVASGEKTFWLGPDGQPVGESAWIVQTDSGCYIVGEGAVTNLPSGFDLNSIANVVVDDGITEIGARFFKKCRKLNAVTLGKGVTKVGENAFYLCLKLENIAVGNPAAVESMEKAVVYQTAIKPDGSLYTIPSIKASGYTEVLYGTDDLANPNWEPVDPTKTMEESGYHFFKFVLKKIEDIR